MVQLRSLYGGHSTNYISAENYSSERFLPPGEHWPGLPSFSILQLMIVLTILAYATSSGTTGGFWSCTRRPDCKQTSEDHRHPGQTQRVSGEIAPATASFGVSNEYRAGALVELSHEAAR